MDATTQLTAIVLILLTFIINALTRRRERSFRRIAVFDVVPLIAGESIEASRPLHLSLGSAAVGDESTMLALVGQEFLYYLTREVAIGDAPPLVTVSEASALPLADDVLRRAYIHEERHEPFLSMNARWYPAGGRSLAFAAALSAMQADDTLSGNVLTGRYGAELALILDAAYRHGNATIAVSDRLDGQAIAYAMADEALIGEEIFAAPGYLSNDLYLQNRNVILDRVRWILLLVLVGLPVLRPVLPTLLERIGNVFGIGG